MTLKKKAGWSTDDFEGQVVVISQSNEVTDSLISWTN